MRTFLRGKVTLLFMMLGLLLAVPAVALADRLDADADSLATGTGGSGNSLTANQQPGTTKTYPFSAAVTDTGNNTDNVFVNTGDKVTVNNSFAGDWLDAAGSSPASFEITAYGQNHSGVISVTVPCNANTTVGSADSKTMTVLLNATASNGKVLNQSPALTYTITASGSPAASCTPADTQVPSVTSINRVSAEKTNTTGNLSWTATFSENVNNVDTGDFAVASNGLSGSPAVTNVTQGANASVYTVTASTGTGSGTLGLNLNDNDSIVDGAGNKLGGQGTGTAAVTSEEPGDGSFAGQAYIIDRAAPTVQGAAFKGPNFAATDTYTANTWTNQSVRVTFTCADTGGSGLTTASGNQTLPDFTAETSASGTNADFSGTCADQAGNTAAAASFGPIKIDKTAPVITDDSTANPPTGTTLNSSGWYTSPVTNTFKATDGLSGFLSSLTDPHTFTVTSGANQEGNAANPVVLSSGTKFDVAGNESNNASSAEFKIDLNNPTVNITNAPAEGAKFDLCSGALPSPSFTASDTALGSGVATSSGSFTNQPTQPPNGSGAGAYTYTAEATDVAGRTGSASRSYSVVYDLNYSDTSGAFSGAQQPINASGTRSSFKLGSTIPVKFQLRCGTQPINNAVAQLWVSQLDNKADTAVNETASTNSPDIGNTFRVTDTATGQYQFNLSTKSPFLNPKASQPTQFALGTWYLYVSLDDGSKFQIAQIDFNK